MEKQRLLLEAFKPQIFEKSKAHKDPWEQVATDEQPYKCNWDKADIIDSPQQLQDQKEEMPSEEELKIYNFEDSRMTIPEITFTSNKVRSTSEAVSTVSHAFDSRSKWFFNGGGWDYGLIVGNWVSWWVGFMGDWLLGWCGLFEMGNLVLVRCGYWLEGFYEVFSRVFWDVKEVYWVREYGFNTILFDSCKFK